MRKEYDFSRGKRGAAIPSPGKTRISIMLDDDVIAAFRERAEAAGSGYQTEINRALRYWLFERPEMSEDTLRRVLREELGHRDAV